MPTYVTAILAVGWLLWLAPFFLNKRKSRDAQTIDRRARWGIALEILGYVLLYMDIVHPHAPEGWRVALSVLFFVLGGFLSWTSMRALGPQWRIDAALNADHELVRKGPYGVVRHPVYFSMLCLLLATGFMQTPLLLLLAAVFVFILGTEIRIRVEEALLEDRFGQQFHEYRRSVAAYIPFVR